MSYTIHSLSYHPKQFFDLGVLLATWAANPEICGSYPIVVHQLGRYYFRVTFGYCPSDSGHDCLFAWDDHNQEFCLWDNGNPLWDWESSVLENAEVRDPETFKTLAELSKWVLTGAR